MDTITTDTEYKYNPIYHRFADFFGIDKFKKDDADIAKKLSSLYEWGARKCKSDNYVDVLKELVKFQKSLGTTDKGETLIKNLYLWARIDMDKLRSKELKKVQDKKIVDDKNEVIERQQRIAKRQKDWKDKNIALEEEKEFRQQQLDKNFKEIKEQKEEQSKLDKGAGLKAVKEIPLEVPKPINLPI